MVWLSDSTVGVGNSAGPLDALAAQAGRIPPRSKFIFGTDHSRATWNDHLFNTSTTGYNFESWLMLHSLDRVEEAGNYVSRAEDSQNYLHYLEASRLVNLLSASADKTALQVRLTALQTTLETGKQRIVLAIGTSANPSTVNYTRITGTATGSSVASLIDTEGNTTAVTFACEYTQWDADLPGAGPGSYHGLPAGVFKQSRRVFQSNTWKFTGLPAGATCRVDIFPYYKTESGTAHYGVTGIIGGQTKNSVDDVYNVIDYLTWESVTANGSGVLSMNLNSQYPSSANDGGICAIMLTTIS